MKNKKEIIKSPDYWFEKIQNEFFRQFYQYVHENKISQADFAKKLNVTKGYISQILNGHFNPTLKKLIELSIAINKIPEINFKDINQSANKNEHNRNFMDIFLNNLDNSCFQIDNDNLVEINHNTKKDFSISNYSYQVEIEKKAGNTLN